jgi:hypothetical protein
VSDPLEMILQADRDGTVIIECPKCWALVRNSGNDFDDGPPTVGDWLRIDASHECAE